MPKEGKEKKVNYPQGYWELSKEEKLLKCNSEEYRKAYDNEVLRAYKKERPKEMLDKPLAVAVREEAKRSAKITTEAAGLMEKFYRKNTDKKSSFGKQK